MSIVEETCKVLWPNTAVKLKGKVHHRTDNEGPEGEWMYCSILSLTSALDRGGCQNQP